MFAAVTSTDLIFDLNLRGNKLQPCLTQEFVDECNRRRFIYQPEPEPEPEPLPVVDEAVVIVEVPFNTDNLIVAAAGAFVCLFCIFYVGYQVSKACLPPCPVAPPQPSAFPEPRMPTGNLCLTKHHILCWSSIYQIKQCARQRVKNYKKSGTLQEVQIMSAQKEAALIAAKMTDASNLKEAGKQLVHAGKAVGQGVKMSMAHHENMRVKAGDFNSALAKPEEDAFGFAMAKIAGSSRVVFGAADRLLSVDGSAPSAKVPRMPKKDVVVELRKRGLPVSGTIDVLKERLVEAMLKEEEKEAAKAAKRAEKKAFKQEAKEKAAALKREERAAQKVAKKEEKLERRKARAEAREVVGDHEFDAEAAPDESSWGKSKRNRVSPDEP